MKDLSVPGTRGTVNGLGGEWTPNAASINTALWPVGTDQ